MSNFYKKLLLVSSAVIFSLQSIASPDIKNTPQQKAPLSFIENKGQVRDQDRNSRPDIQFQLKAAGGLSIFIGDGAIHYQFSKADKEIKQPSKEDRMKPGYVPEPTTFTMDRMDVELVGANRNAQVLTEQKQDYYENYFTDWSGKKGSIVLAFNRITYKNIYPNIDWVLYTSNGTLEHEFVVHQGGKVSDIQLKYGGAKDLKVNADGSLTATTPQGTITEKAPNTFQKDGKKVNSGFMLNGNTISYQIGTYSGELVIDPTLLWSTYYGGSALDNGSAIATDGSGNAYITGYTSSVSGIATSGAYLTTLTGSTDAYIAKFTLAGSIVWATYYGGGGEFGYAITLDATGNIYIAGNASSTTGVATSGAYMSSYGGGSTDAFLAKFTNAGGITWATYFGGSNIDYGTCVTTDAFGHVYLGGETNSTTGIATSGAFQTAFGGSYDAFLAQFSSSGALQWSTYLGGSQQESGASVVTDAAGLVYFAGMDGGTPGLPTSGAYFTVPYVNSGFLIQFNSAGTRQWATYFGGNVNSLTLDGSGYLYLAGNVTTSAFVGTPGTYQSTAPGGVANGFLSKFSTSGTFQWATYVGGPESNYCYSTSVDGSGNIYVSGETSSTSGIATSGAYQTVIGGGMDCFLSKFDNTGNIIWSTYFGGPLDDIGSHVATYGTQYVYLIGTTSNTSAIATSGSVHLDITTSAICLKGVL